MNRWKLVTLAVEHAPEVSNEEIEESLACPPCESIVCLTITDPPTVIDQLQSRLEEVTNERNMLRTRLGGDEQ